MGFLNGEISLWPRGCGFDFRLCYSITVLFIQSSAFQCLRQMNVISNKIVMFCIWLHIVCTTWLPEVCDYQHHQNLDIIFSDCRTSDIKISLHFNGSLWELGRWTRFRCKLHQNSTEYICWVNGFMSLKVQDIRLVSNHHAAAAAVHTTRNNYPDKFSCWTQWKNYSGQMTRKVSYCILTAGLFEASLIPQNLDVLKPFSQKMCSILCQHNLHLNLVPPLNSHRDPFKNKEL